MQKFIVVYYSNTGSNHFLAEKIADALQCDLERIRPRINRFMFLLIFSWLNIPARPRALQHDLKNYEKVILVGPVWMGSFIAPLRGFISKYRNQINTLWFITCCGSSDKKRDEKFGHAHVFRLVKERVGKKCIDCEAFPIGLVLPEEKQDDGEVIMNTRLSEQNFGGEIQTRFDNLIQRISG